MPQEWSREGVKWKEINTDQMTVQKERFTVYGNEGSLHPLKYNGLSPDHFTDEIINGFSEMYKVPD